MTRRLKVYGITVMAKPSWDVDTREARAIVAATSEKAAVEAFNAAGMSMSLHGYRQYGSTTGNEIELAVATEPGIVYIAPDRRTESAIGYERVTP